jgi:hypothetical protein
MSESIPIPPVTIYRKGRKPLVLTAEEFKAWVGREECKKCGRLKSSHKPHRCTETTIIRPRRRHLEYEPIGDGVDANFASRSKKRVSI